MTWTQVTSAPIDMLMHFSFHFYFWNTENMPSLILYMCLQVYKSHGGNPGVVLFNHKPLLLVNADAFII